MRKKTIIGPKHLRLTRNQENRQNRQKDKQPYHLESIILKASTLEKINYFKQSKK